MAFSQTAAPAPVVWISGFSASGKTTVGRHVEATLRQRGAPVIFLDGDDLRSIFAGRWGYSPDERTDLARVYFRLCSHLSSQGFTVVICAVAMYEDARRWLRENVPAALEVFLDVPEDERQRRDGATKKIYAQLQGDEPGYDLPEAPDVVVRNHGNVTPEEAAAQIVRALDDRPSERRADHGRSGHWEAFYANPQAPVEPSSFARAVSAVLDQPVRLLEIGCGNGRDAAFFAGEGHDVVAVDRSAVAIDTARATHGAERLEFRAGEISELNEDDGAFGAIYSRFCLHAMTPPEEDEFLRHARRLLPPAGRLLIECRSINDPLARKGEVISKTERLHGHYRRFIVAGELRAKLDALGFAIVEFTETAGVAKLGDDDPVVLRVVAAAA